VRYSYRRRRAVRAAVRGLLAFPARHPRVVAAPLTAAAVLGGGAVLRPVAPLWQVAALGAVVATFAAVQIIRAPMPLWRRAAWWAAIAAGLASLLGGWWWAAVLLGAAVAVGVVELPRWPRVTIEGEWRELPDWARPRLRTRGRTRWRAGRVAAADVARGLFPRDSGPETPRETPRTRTAPAIRPTPRTVQDTAGRPSETPRETVVAATNADDETMIVRRLLADGRTAAPVELYRALGVSRATLHRRATQWLADGWLVRADGGGYRLAEPPADAVG